MEPKTSFDEKVISYIYALRCKCENMNETNFCLLYNSIPGLEHRLEARILEATKDVNSL